MAANAPKRTNTGMQNPQGAVSSAQAQPVGSTLSDLEAATWILGPNRKIWTDQLCPLSNEKSRFQGNGKP